MSSAIPTNKSRSEDVLQKWWCGDTANHNTATLWWCKFFS